MASCLGETGFRSFWYAVTVPEPSVLRVLVTSTSLGRFQPVVTIYNAEREELACGLSDVLANEPGEGASASAYVSDGVYLIRVAQANNFAPSTQRPQIITRVWGRDVTPPEITLVQQRRPPQPGDRVTFSATGRDIGSGVNADSAVWMFGDRRLQSTNTTTGTQTVHKVGSTRVEKFSLRLRRHGRQCRHVPLVVVRP